MVLSIYLGRNGERVILSITETLLPATSLSQRALEAYQNQLKSYDDAVVLGESAYVKQAQDYAQQAIGALNELRELKNLGPTRIQELSNIDTKLRYFTEMAQDKYAQMANGAGGIERDPLKDNRAILEVRLTTLERAISKRCAQASTKSSMTGDVSKPITSRSLLSRFSSRSGSFKT